MLGYRDDTGVWPKQVQLFEAFLQARELAEERIQEAGLTFESARASEDDLLQEAGSTSDFATYLNNKITKRLMWGYNEAPSAWRRYSRLYSVPDYKPIEFTRVSEQEDLLPVPEGGTYHDSAIEQIVGPTLTIGKFGRTMSLTREALINDDLNQLRDRPAALGRAAARSLAKNVNRKLRENPKAYDGTAVFAEAHGNLSTEKLEETPLGSAITSIRIQTEYSGNRIGLRPRTLVVPPEQEMMARRILNSAFVPQPAGSEGVSGETTPFGRGGDNVLSGLLDYVVEDYLTDADDWYVFCDPNEAPVLGVGFLNGVETPDIFLKDPGMRNVLGGSDPYSMEYDEIEWKVRQEYGTGFMDFRGAFAALID